jgi:hypothetical protein
MQVKLAFTSGDDGIFGRHGGEGDASRKASPLNAAAHKNPKRADTPAVIGVRRSAYRRRDTRPEPA